MWLSSVFLAYAFSLPTQSYAETWIGGLSNWNDTNAWQEGTIPNGVGQVATFYAVAGTAYGVFLNGQQTIGELNLLGETNGGYMFQTGTLVFSVANGNATINTTNSNVVQDFGWGGTVNVELASNTVFNTSGESATLKFGSTASISGAGILIKKGFGILYLNGTNTYTGGTMISEGSVVVNHENSGVIDALGSGLITLSGGRLHSAFGSSTLNSYLVAAGTTGTISTATGTSLWLNGGSGQSFSLQGDLVIGASDGAGTVVMDVIGMNAAPGSTLAVAYGRLVNGNGSLGNLAGFAGATRVASGATLDMSTYGGTIRNLQDATPGNGGTVSWASNPLYVYGGSFSGRSALRKAAISLKGVQTLFFSTATIIISAA